MPFLNTTSNLLLGLGSYSNFLTRHSESADLTIEEFKVSFLVVFLTHILHTRLPEPAHTSCVVTVKDLLSKTVYLVNTMNFSFEMFPPPQWSFRLWKRIMIFLCISPVLWTTLILLQCDEQWFCLSASREECVPRHKTCILFISVHFKCHRRVCHMAGTLRCN